MFHLLRRIILTCFVVALLGLGAFLYQKRAVLMPVVDYYNAFEISQEGPRRTLESLAGEVTKITGEYAFQIRTDANATFGIQLTGLESPSPADTAEGVIAKLKEESRSRLGELLLARRARVETTYLNEKRSGLGLVYLAETNVNAALVEAGLARLNRNFLKGLPAGRLYELLSAERKAKADKRGVWRE